MPTIRTNGIQTYYEEYGEGLPIVFLHGATSDHRLWAEQARPLASDYRVITYDLRGHGRTGGSERGSYTMELYTDDLGALVTALDLDRPAICGLSMGVMVAQTYAAESPDTIAALCTLGTLTLELLSCGEWVERRLVPKIADTLSPLIEPDRIMGILDRVYDWKYGEEAIGDLEEIGRIQQAHAEKFPEILETELAKVDDMLTSYPLTTVDHASISVPSLLMYGERETKTAARHAEHMASTIPVAETRRIPNAGHNSHVDNPDFVIDLLRELLDTATDDRHGTDPSVDERRSTPLAVASSLRDWVTES